MGFKESNRSRKFIHKNSRSPNYHHSFISSHFYPEATPYDFVIVEKKNWCLKTSQKNMRELKEFKMWFSGHFCCLFFWEEKNSRGQIPRKRGSGNMGWQIGNGLLPLATHSLEVGRVLWTAALCRAAPEDEDKADGRTRAFGVKGVMGTVCLRQCLLSPSLFLLLSVLQHLPNWTGNLRQHSSGIFIMWPKMKPANMEGHVIARHKTITFYRYHLSLQLSALEIQAFKRNV